MARARHHATLGDLPGRDRDSATRRRRRSAAPKVVPKASWHPVSRILAASRAIWQCPWRSPAEHRRQAGTQSRGLAACRLVIPGARGLPACRAPALKWCAARGRLRGCEGRGAGEIVARCIRRVAVLCAAQWTRYGAAAALRSRCVSHATPGGGLPISAHKARLRVLPRRKCSECCAV